MQEGGRKVIPREGAKYCPLIRMYENENYEEWSICFLCPDFRKENHVKFRFLSATAPSELLIVGNTYSIYEGNKEVAEMYIENKTKEETR